MSSGVVAGVTEVSFVSRRNNSLSPGGRALVLGSLAVVILVISLGFALNGAWLVLPFAGLDFLVVYLAFRYVERRSDDYEYLSLSGDQVLIERRERGGVRKYELNRHWVQVIYSPARGMETGRLALRSHGHEVEFGIHLNEEQRAEMARRLKDHLKTG